MAVLHDLPVEWSFDADGEAFDAIYREHRVALLAFCRSRLRDTGDAEDACQEAFLRAYRALPRFDRAQRMWPWLATIAANVCTDMRRRKRPVPLSALDRDPRTGTVDPDRDADVRATVQLVGSAIRDLPDAYRTSVYLADLEGWSYDEIARHQQKSLASVRSTLMRGRSAFKTRVQSLAEERGMWPLAAALPFPWLRFKARVAGWRATRDADAAAASAPSAFSAVQAAAAAFALFGSVVSGTIGVAGAEAKLPPITSHSIPADRVVTAVPIATADSDGPADQPPAAAPMATTDIDLSGDRRSVKGGVDVGDDDGSTIPVWQGIELDCRSEVRQRVCDAVDVAVAVSPVG